MAQANWDALTVDLQHGHVDNQVGITMLQAIATTNTTPLARVPWCEPGIIMKMLDAGAYGIICPMINTRTECEAFVGACRYPPRGYRSFGPVRATWYAGADYFKHANETLITMAMIETKQAMENLDEILSVPDLDSLYIEEGSGLAFCLPPSDETRLCQQNNWLFSRFMAAGRLWSNTQAEPGVMSVAFCLSVPALTSAGSRLLPAIRQEIRHRHIQGQVKARRRARRPNRPPRHGLRTRRCRAGAHDE